MLYTIFTSEGRDRIWKEKEDSVEVEGPRTPQEVTDRLRCVLPQEMPNWNPNTDDGIKSLNDYHVALLKGLHSAAQQPTNLTRVGEVCQAANRSPSAFLKYLWEAYCMFTPYNPLQARNARVMNMSFIISPQTAEMGQICWNDYSSVNRGSSTGLQQ